MLLSQQYKVFWLYLGPTGGNLFFSLTVMDCGLTIYIFCSVHSLTERAQLLKNVFKKNTVNMYRSESVQQNLLRKCLITATQYI